MSKIDYKIWGKFDRVTKKIHPALFHMLDVGFVAKEILYRLPDIELECIVANSLELTKDEAVQFIVGVAPYHDIGKITPNFAIQSEGYKPLLNDGYNFFGLDGNNKLPHFRHEVFSKKIMSGKLPETLCSILGGHHGLYSVLPRRRKPDGKFFLKCLKDDRWKEQQELAINVIQDVFPIPSRIWKKVKLPKHLYFYFSGLLSLADWIASDKKFFPFAGEKITWQEYVKELPQKAKFALDTIKMDLCPIKNLSFKQMFNMDPYESQKTVIKIADKLKEPSLVILEDCTGNGKTEAAFYTANKLMENAGHRGIQILMPTQATTNAMANRTVKYLKKIADGEANFQIGHGNANFHEWYKKIDTKDNIYPFEWFNSGKRKFFSQFGDSTIDQALFGAIPVKYFFLRLYGLANKVVIFDEIHAYDTYMIVLIKRLLKQLRNLRCSVIMLSATLTKQMKKELVEAYSGKLEKDVPYPRICVVSGNKTIIKKLPSVKTKTIKLDHFYVSPTFKIKKKNGIVFQQYFELLKHVLKKIKNGGCLAIVCNTVKQSQTINKLLSKIAPDIHRKIIHARFRNEDKTKLEQEILSCYGKDAIENGNRPFKSILVGTQIIEQSLNIDFDYMLTFLCPIDLLLQRGGRNHRFTMNRPLGLRSPRMGIVYEYDADGILENYVYDSYTMQRTYDILHNKTQLKIPDMVEELIEYAYKPFDKLTKKEQGIYDKSYNKLEKKEVKEKNLANSIVLKEDNNLNINPPEKHNVKENFVPSSSKIEEKDGKLSTRNIVLAMKVVILFKKRGDKRWYLDPKREILAPNFKIQNITIEKIELLQKSQCPIIGNPYFSYFQKKPEEWKNTLLRHCGRLILNEHNYFRSKNFEATYDVENGLQLNYLKK